MEFKKVIGNEAPQTIDVTSSKKVYVRRDIKKVEDTENNTTYYEYQEACMSKNDFEEYKNQLLKMVLNGEENSQANENYTEILNTPIAYTNGKMYRPRYIEDYSKVMNDLLAPILLAKLIEMDLTPFLSRKFTIYDATGKEANAVEMEVQELITLYLSLYFKKEDLFKAYKKEKELGNE